jgi:DNA-binding response OmpR family regulator
VAKILIVEDDNVIADGMARTSSQPDSTRSSSAAASSG